MENRLSPVLGVVTVTFNAEPFIDEFMRCCLAQNFVDFRLLVIDNNSSDGSLQAVRSYSDNRIEVLINQKNVGYAVACNQAIEHFKQIGTQDILFINNDTVFGDMLFADLLHARHQHASDAVTPRITYESDPDRNWYAGGRLNYWRGFQGEHIGEGLLNDPTDTVPRITHVAPGCCVLFSMSIFDEVGQFDPAFFVYGEDTDLFIRMRRKGKTLLYHPGIVLEHKVSLSTGGAQSDFSIHYYHRNQIYLIRKHLSVMLMPIQLVVILVKAFTRLIIGLDTPRQFSLRLKGLAAGFKV